MKNINDPELKKETKSNENATNEVTDLLNIQERGELEEGQQLNDNRSEAENELTQNDFGVEDLDKNIITNNPDEKEEIF